MPALSFRNKNPVAQKAEKQDGSSKSLLSFLPSINRTPSKIQAIADGQQTANRRSADDVINAILGTKPSSVRSSSASSSGSVGDLLKIGEMNTDVKKPTPPRVPRSASAVYDLIPGKLCMAFHPTQDFSRAEIKRRPDLFFFSTDLHERYVPFCKDFGPVSLGIIYHFWQYVQTKEHHPLLRGRPLVYYTDLQDKNHANAAVLLGAYMMLEHGMSAAEAAKPFQELPQYPLVAFRDCTHSTADFGITLEDCLLGVEKAMSVGWFDKNKFDVDQFEELEDPQNGDVSLIGDKFVAFRGPKVVADDKDHWVCPPTFYTSLFKELGVTAVVRLNEVECYDKADFEKDGITVHDLEFADCTCPSPALVKKFLDVVEGSEGRVAVHCKAGLGRTGTMIGLWMMKNKGFSAREAIAWMRLCRPGCVIGQQQHFLAACEKMTWDGNSAVLARRSSSSSRGGPLARIRLMQEASGSGLVRKEELARQVELGSRRRAMLRAGGQ